MDQTTRWLLDGPSWVEYRTRIDLLGQEETDPEVATARQAMLADPQVRELVRLLQGWPANPSTGVSNASHPMNRLVFLANIGLKATDPGIRDITDKVLSHQSSEGAFQVSSGGNSWSWKTCDFPSIVYALIRMGLETDPQVLKAVGLMEKFSFENGWPCVMSRDIQWYSEPGPYDDCCPIVNIIALKALALLPDRRNGKAARDGAETLLYLWDHRKTERPNMFGIGKRFSQLKAPFVWYDLLHMLDILTQFPHLSGDPRLQEMLNVVKDKAGPDKRFTVESVSAGWNGWDFGQDREPSRWLTFLVHRIFKRAGMMV